MKLKKTIHYMLRLKGTDRYSTGGRFPHFVPSPASNEPPALFKSRRALSLHLRCHPIDRGFYGRAKHSHAPGCFQWKLSAVELVRVGVTVSMSVDKKPLETKELTQYVKEYKDRKKKRT